MNECSASAVCVCGGKGQQELIVGFMNIKETLTGLNRVCKVRIWTSITQLLSSLVSETWKSFVCDLDIEY